MMVMGGNHHGIKPEQETRTNTPSCCLPKAVGVAHLRMWTGSGSVFQS